MGVPARVLLVDKPPGPTSFDVVRKARKGFGGRVGHAGTLDPFATGLLLVMMGQATRLSSLFLGLPKEYELTVQFGAVSTTGDPTGEITQNGQRTCRSDVLKALDGFRGQILQKVPMTSAVKVAGEALYKRAHRGESTETPERKVTVYDLCLLDFDDEKQTARIVALTSAGTYLRVLAEDLGKTLGVGGHAVALRRTRIGLFSVSDAISFESLSPSSSSRVGVGVLDMDGALAALSAVEVDSADARLASNGNSLPIDREGRFRVHVDGRLLGIYESRSGTARPLLVFPREGSDV